MIDICGTVHCFRTVIMATLNQSSIAHCVRRVPYYYLDLLQQSFSRGFDSLLGSKHFVSISMYTSVINSIFDLGEVVKHLTKLI